jgi:integrase
MRGLYKRHRRWWFRFRHRGEQRFVNLGTESEAEAVELALRVLEDPEPFLGGRTMVADLLDVYLARKAKRGISETWIEEERLRVGAFVRDLGIRHPSDIEPGKVAKWLEPHWERNPETGNAYRATMQRFCRWLVAEGHLLRDPCAEVPAVRARVRVRRRFLSREECRCLLDAADDRDMRTALYLALHAGLRKGEVLAARPEWVDLPARLLHVSASADWQPKDRDHRTIPITEEFAQWLEGTGLSAPYLVRPDKAGSGRYRWDMRVPFSEVLAKAGIDCTFHDLRRTFASLHVSAGTSIYKVARWMGDGVAVVERHYGHLSPSDSEINRAWK